MIRERSSFAFSGSRTGRLHAVRVFSMVMLLAGLVWYGKMGNNPFAVTRTIRVISSADGYNVEFLEITGAGAGTKKDTVRADAVRKTVFPFAENSGIKAVLTEFAGVSVMIADSSIIAVGENYARSMFYERLDLLIIPPADEQNAKSVRDLFRPRLLAVVPPCPPGIQNITCADVDFTVKRGKIVK